MLRARGIRIADPQILARTAWTTDELSDAIAQANPQGPFALVSLCVGVNDQYRSRPIGGFLTEFSALLERARTLADEKAWRVIVLSIPDWGATPFAEGRDRELITREIASYNDAARGLAERAGARWIDVTDVSRQMRVEPALIAPDGLHPSGEMYRRWAAKILPVAVEALGAG
jgi:lysophospholipase L1-like esterase